MKSWIVTRNSLKKRHFQIKLFVTLNKDHVKKVNLRIIMDPHYFSTHGVKSFLSSLAREVDGFFTSVGAPNLPVFKKACIFLDLHNYAHFGLFIGFPAYSSPFAFQTLQVCSKIYLSEWNDGWVKFDWSKEEKTSKCNQWQLFTLCSMPSIQ